MSQPTLFESNLKILLKDVSFLNKKLFLKGRGYYIVSHDNESPVIEIQTFKNKLYRYYIRRRDKDVPQAYEKVILLKEHYSKLLKGIFNKEIDENWLVSDIVFEEIPVLRKGYTDRVIEKGVFFQKRPYEPPIKKGDLIDIPMPITRIDSTWFWIYGRIFPVENNDDVIRFYFNFNKLERLDIIDSFIENVVFELNQRNISFKLKLPSEISERNGFFRADAVVIYIEKLSFFLVSNIIYTIHQKFEEFLYDEIPLFTAKIGKGLGMAEEPKDFFNRSFGENNISMIVDKIVEIYSLSTATKQATSQEIVDRVVSEIKTLLINPTSPFLLRNTFLPDDFPTFLKLPTLPKLNSEETYLKYAVQIGYQLCNSAIFSFRNKPEQVQVHEQVCSWLTAREKTEEGRLKVTRVKSNIYNGSIGISWFLWKLFEVYPDYPFYFTALSGIRNVCKNKPPSKLGFFEGKLGLLYCLNQVLASKFMTEDKVKKEFEGYKTTLMGGINESFKNIEKSRFGDILFGINKNSLKGIDEKYIIDLLKNFDFKDELGEFSDSVTQVFMYGDYTNRITLLSVYKKILKIIEEQKITLEKVDSTQIKSESENYDFIFKIALSRTRIHKNIDKVLPSYFAKSEYLKNKEYYFEMINYLEKLAVELLSYQADNNNNSLLKGVWGAVDLFLTVEQISDNTFNQIPKKLNIDILFDKVIGKYLKNDLLPPFEFGHEFYNPGLLDGLSGLGYILLRAQYPTQIKSIFFKD